MTLHQHASAVASVSCIVLFVTISPTLGVESKFSLSSVKNSPIVRIPRERFFCSCIFCMVFVLIPPWCSLSYVLLSCGRFLVFSLTWCGLSSMIRTVILGIAWPFFGTFTSTLFRRRRRTQSVSFKVVVIVVTMDMQVSLLPPSLFCYSVPSSTALPCFFGALSVV